MAILIFVLSLILLIAAAASGYQSLDLLPTSIGVLYALAASSRRLRRGGDIRHRGSDPAHRHAHEARAAVRWTLDLSAGFGVTPWPRPRRPRKLSAAPSAIEAEALGERWTKRRRPRTRARSTSIAPAICPRSRRSRRFWRRREPHGPPSLIGSYSSAGANYKIFSDGSIEAETSEGTFKFASMSDFKRHLLERKGATSGA